MTSLKFFKGAFTNDTTYVDGGIYFDNTTHEIRVGNALNSYDSFGSDIKDVTWDDETYKLTISFYGKSDIVLDFSDVPSSEEIAARFEEVNSAIAGIKALHAKDESGNPVAVAAEISDWYDAKVADGESLMSDTEHDKLDGIEAGAQVNKIETIKINGEAVTPTDKEIDITIPEGAEYNLVKDAESGDYAAVYHLTKDGENIGAAINIPKDMVVESGSIVKDPVGQPAGLYILLIIANKTQDHIYIPVDSLVVNYTSGSSASDAIVVSVDNDAHKISASLSAGSVTENHLHADLKAKINGKVDRQVIGANGKAYIFNESDGGGAQFIHNDGTESYIGVNDGGENGMAGQIYVDKWDGNKWDGSSIKLYHDKFYYQNRENRTSGEPDASFEIATVGQLPGEATSAVLGTVKYDDATIKKNEDGQLYVNIGAISNVSVEEGDGITVVEDIDMGGKATYVVSAKVDNSTIKINADKKLYVPVAASGVKGVVTSNDEVSIDENGGMHVMWKQYE